jgi:hypothetical protein
MANAGVLPNIHLNIKKADEKREAITHNPCAFSASHITGTRQSGAT